MARDGLFAACALLCAAASPASADSPDDARVFPATIGIENPTVGDSLALPGFSTMTGAPEGGPVGYALGGDYSKTITPSLEFTLGTEGYRWQRRPAAQGWGVEFFLDALAPNAFIGKPIFGAVEKY
jgi:hypothetical protein